MQQEILIMIIGQILVLLINIFQSIMSGHFSTWKSKGTVQGNMNEV